LWEIITERVANVMKETEKVCWSSSLCPEIKKLEHDISETGSVSVLR
jgi:hypothetical protein